MIFERVFNVTSRIGRLERHSALSRTETGQPWPVRESGAVRPGLHVTVLDSTHDIQPA